MRWLVVAFGVAATIHSFVSRREMPGREGRSRWDTLFMLSVDLQVLFGLLLYFGLSPFTMAGMNDFHAALHEPVVRFWTITHIGLMFSAALLIRVGRVLALNAPDARTRRMRRGVVFAAALLIIAWAMPWPGTAAGRPLFRF